MTMDTLQCKITCYTVQSQKIIVLYCNRLHYIKSIWDFWSKR